MRILLIAPKFNGYYSDIVDELKRQSHEVDYFFDENYLKGACKYIAKYFIYYRSLMFDKYFKNEMMRVNHKHFDIILLIFGGRCIEEKHIQEIKALHPEAKLIYYNWDSVKNFPNVLGFLHLFDERWSFDQNDCEKYGFQFLPLFYCNKKIAGEPIYDVATIMGFSSNKAKSFALVKSKLPDNIRMNQNLVLPSKLSFFKNKVLHPRLFKGFKKNDFLYSSLSRDESYQVMANARAIIDCPLDGQNGLTIRTFEVLAQNRKLITTNSNVVNYDFYDSRNIFVINSDTGVIPISFFETPFIEKENVINSYSLPAFLKKLIG